MLSRRIILCAALVFVALLSVIVYLFVFNTHEGSSGQPLETAAVDPLPERAAPAPLPMPDIERHPEYYDYDGPELKLFCVSSDVFRAFIETVDISIMHETKDILFFHSPESEEHLVRWLFSYDHGGWEIMKDQSVSYGFHSMVADRTLVESYASAQGLERILGINGIDCKVEDSFMFYHWLHEANGIPAAVVAYTDAGVYFMEVKQLDGLNVHTVFSHAEYYEKYRLHKGALSVNDKMTELGALTFEGIRMMMPLSALFESLGYGVSEGSDMVSLQPAPGSPVDVERVSTTFEKNGGGLVLELTGGVPSIRRIGSLAHDDVIPYTAAPFEITEDDFFVDEPTLRNILSLVGASVTVDYNTREVRVAG